MKILKVSHKFDNKKLVAFLSYEFPKISQNMFYKALRKKDIRINDIKISENVLIYEGDTIKLYIADKYFEEPNLDINIVYEDDNILVISKPKDIEVTGENSLTSYLSKNYYNSEILPCHRLDRNTEGLVIFAKSKISLEILLNKFKLHEISKYYKCKVHGTFKKKHDILKAYLFKDNKKSMVYISDKKEKGYREIITEYNVLEENFEKNFSILDVMLHTGLTHKIRAHLAYLGHPIIGDRKIWQ